VLAALGLELSNALPLPLPAKRDPAQGLGYSCENRFPAFEGFTLAHDRVN
jgi:hypothetical protein